MRVTGKFHLYGLIGPGVVGETRGSVRSANNSGVGLAARLSVTTSARPGHSRSPGALDCRAVSHPTVADETGSGSVLRTLARWLGDFPQPTRVCAAILKNDQQDRNGRAGSEVASYPAIEDDNGYRYDR